MLACRLQLTKNCVLPPPPPSLSNDAPAAHPLRAGRCLPAWRALAKLTLSTSEADRLLRIIQHGYSTNIHSPPPNVREFPAVLRHRDDANVISSEIEKLLSLGVLLPCETNLARLILPTMVVRAAGKDPRLVVNGRPFSAISDHEPTFRPDDLRVLSDIVAPSDHTFATDVVKLFYLIPTSTEIRPFLCIRDPLTRRLYTFAACPMGIQQTPSIAHLFMRPLILSLRRFVSARLVLYVDDILGAAPTPHLAVRTAAWLTQLTARLGIPLHPRKSDFQPRQDREFLGMRILTSNADAVHISLTDRRRAMTLARIRSTRRLLLRSKPISASHLASLLGLVASSALACWPARLLTRHLHRLQASVVRVVGWHAQMIPPRQLANSAVDELYALRRVFAGRLPDPTHPLRPQHLLSPSIVVTSDASTEWGAGLFLSDPNEIEVPSASWQAPWPHPSLSATSIQLPSAIGLLSLIANNTNIEMPPLVRQTAQVFDNVRHLFTSDKTWHINELELLTSTLALPTFPCRLRHQQVLFRLDNTVAIVAINKSFSPSPRLAWMALLHRLSLLLLRSTAVAVHLPGVINNRADSLSRRWQDPQRRRVHQPLIQQAVFNIASCLRAQPPEIDAFASWEAHQLPTYWSWSSDPGSSATDALAQRWTGRSLFINPPFVLARRVVTKLLTERPSSPSIVVLPDWVTVDWRQDLDRMSIRSVRLPQRLLLRRPRRARWKLRAWLLDGS